MKKLLIAIIPLLMFINLHADVHRYNHPMNEPNGLYLITLKELSRNGYAVYRDYRLYCPKLTIREITDGKKRPSHNVKDILEFHDSNFYSDIKMVCSNKKNKAMTTVAYSPRDNINNIVIEDMSDGGEFGKVRLQDKYTSCGLTIDKGRITQTNCIRLTNSKNVKIICTVNKRMCKTEEEVFSYIDKKLSEASMAMREYQEKMEAEAYTYEVEARRAAAQRKEVEDRKRKQETNFSHSASAVQSSMQSTERTSIQSQVSNDTSHTTCIPNILSYCNLPIKKDLSYFAEPQNIVGQMVLSKDRRGVGYSNDLNMRKKVFDEYFSINKNNISILVNARINSSNFNEFEIDDFETRLQYELDKSFKNIRQNYKKVDNHIRIINLNIPVQYSKDGKSMAKVKIKNMKFIQALNFSKPMLSSDFIRKVLNNNFISRYIIPSKEKYNFGASIEYDGDFLSVLRIKGSEKIINEIGKKNKGKGIITELTLHASLANTGEIKFVITSFKLKRSDNRFVLNYYVDNLNDDLISPYKANYQIQDNNFLMYINGDN